MTEITDKINDASAGALAYGFINVDPTVTPFLNLWAGPTFGRKFTMLQGVQDDAEATNWPDDSGSIVQIDSDGDYIWLNQ